MLSNTQWSIPGPIPVWVILSLLAGAVTTLAFAPFNFLPLVFVTLSFALYSWQNLPQKQAVISAWLFGVGLQCSGVSWIFYSLHTHGSAPAIFAVLLVFLLACYLSIYTGLAVYIVKRFLPDSETYRLLLFYPASWVVFEWLQGYVMTGFAWMQLGYTQIDLPLSGIAPVFGNHAVSGLVVMTAGAITLLVSKSKEGMSGKLIVPVAVVATVWLGAGLLKNISWTEAEGESLRVSVIQGNIPQSEKWKMHNKQPTLDMYKTLTLAQKDIDLYVWPETAVPDYWYRVVPYIKDLSNEMKQRDADLLLGIFVKNDERRLLNSVLNVNDAVTLGIDGGVYSKRHLVPLGEFIPLRFLIEFFNHFVDIPMSDIASGYDDQRLLNVSGIDLGVSICFEEAFARDVIKDLPQAKLLVNVSNDAWFEDSHEPHQHHTIARMRALESGRYMIRSTNTGITSLINDKGEVIKRIPQFEQAVLNGEVQPMVGATPFVRWGDQMILGLSVLVLLGFALNSRKSFHC